MNSNRPITTLFLVQSLDGKITLGDTDELDVDRDFPKIRGVKEGLYQYYELEQQTDLVSMNTGVVQKKVGVNQKSLDNIEKTDVSFIMVDSLPHLDAHGCEYFAKYAHVFYLVTTNPAHPVFSLTTQYSNIKTFLYDKQIDFTDFFVTLKQKHNVERITVQSGGVLNAHLLSLRLIDYVSLVIAPCLIGGSQTQSLIGGESLHAQIELNRIRPLRLLESNVLKHSYLHLKYEVDNTDPV
jgi:2,5-diamino-6-(ribosylamino)-4(3H)-pyrimidinone 5'-phosphate reductase